MRLHQLLALFGACVSTSAHQLEVELSGTHSPLVIQALFRNNGPDSLALLKAGTILGSSRVRFLDAERVDAGGIESLAAFQGIIASVDYLALRPESYELIQPGSTVSREVDVAALYELQVGTYSLSAAGSVPAQPDQVSFKPTASVAYESNTLTVTVDEAAVSRSQATRLQQRAIVQDEWCSNSTQRDIILGSLQNCKPLAEAAAAEARDTTSLRFVEYFRSNDTEARKMVSDRLSAVAEECSTIDSGGVRVFCSEPYEWDECSAPLVAYTFATSNWIVGCPLFYDTRPSLPQECHRQDQATTMIHEMTHNSNVYSIATQDAAYSYPNVTQLDAGMALYNADTYSLFANAVYLDCPIDSLPEGF